MLNGFQYVLAQIGVVVAVTALLAGVLGWLIGHGSRRRTEKAFEDAVAAISRTEPGASPFAPPPTRTDEAETLVAEPSGGDAAAGSAALATTFPPLGATPIDHVPPYAVHDPDATVIRSTPVPQATPYVPPVPVIASVPMTPASSPYGLRTAAPVSPSEEVDQLRQELRTRDLEVGRLEAGALSAWDRTVPPLQEQIRILTRQNDDLLRSMRAAGEHSDADAVTLDHLRAQVVERDLRIAELRAHA